MDRYMIDMRGTIKHDLGDWVQYHEAEERIAELEDKNDKQVTLYKLERAEIIKLNTEQVKRIAELEALIKKYANGLYRLEQQLKKSSDKNIRLVNDVATRVRDNEILCSRNGELQKLLISMGPKV